MIMITQEHEKLFKQKKDELIYLTNEIGQNREERGFRPLFTICSYYTIRDLKSQAKLWRQSRSYNEIYILIRKMEKEGAPFISHIVDIVGKQYGRWATNCIPGQSWHNWNLAVDCFVKNEQNKAVWSSKHDGYKIYAETAKKLELTSGFFWHTKCDAVHVQFFNGNVRERYTWKEINDIMKERFPENE